MTPCRELIGFDALEYSQIADSDGELAGIDHFVIGWKDGSTHEIACLETDCLARLFVASPELYRALEWAIPHLETLVLNWENEYEYDTEKSPGRLGAFAEDALNRLQQAKTALAQASGVPVFESESQSEGNSNPVTDNPLIAPSTDPVKGEGK